LVFPEKFPENQKYDNSKEKEFYFRFQNELPEDWDIYYSFKFYNPGIPIRELDYIIVCPLGIYIIELKNARFRYENNIWQIYDSREKKWKEHVKHFYTGPIEQVESAVKMFKNFLMYNNHLKIPVDSNSITGVVFLNKNEVGQFSKKLPNKEIIIFHKELQHQSLFDILDSIHKSKRISNLTHLEREKIKNIILINGNYYPGFPARRDEQKKLMIALTKEQFMIMEGFKDQARMILYGVVGSGKTMMARKGLEIAIENSWRCLYLCSSIHLKDFFENLYKDKEKVKFFTFYDFRFVKNISETFDFIIIDEAQNIISGDMSDILDNILSGGLNNGKWLICFDKEQKNKEFDSDFLKIISSYPHESYSLNSNIRNPSEIFNIASLLGGKKQHFSKVPDALSVKFVSFIDDLDASIKLFELIDYGIRQLKLFPDEIIILSPFPLKENKEIQSNFVRSYDNKRFYEIVKYNSDEPDREKINFSVIEDFQGLEASFVILIGVKDLNDSFLRSQYYIALTRSTYSAGILFHKDLFSDLNNIINMDS
jgi:hypothetical protein